MAVDFVIGLDPFDGERIPDLVPEGMSDEEITAAIFRAVERSGEPSGRGAEEVAEP
jgi:hypothetical protein